MQTGNTIDKLRPSICYSDYISFCTLVSILIDVYLIMYLPLYPLNSNSYVMSWRQASQFSCLNHLPNALKLIYSIRQYLGFQNICGGNTPETPVLRQRRVGKGVKEIGRGGYKEYRGL